MVGSVLRGPSWILKHVSEDSVGDAGVVVAHTNVTPPHLDMDLDKTVRKNVKNYFGKKLHILTVLFV